MDSRILTREEWRSLEIAEHRYYRGDGTHAYTSVNVREESESIAWMWDWAELGVSDITGTEADEPRELQKEIAARVAHAIATLAFGVDFAAEGRAA